MDGKQSLVENARPDERWLGLASAEPVIEPELAIVDAHHHLTTGASSTYDIDRYRADIATGHRVAATVFVESGIFHRQRDAGMPGAIDELRAVAGASKRDPVLCRALVGYADLTDEVGLGGAVDDLTAAAGGRLRGLRYCVASHADAALRGRIADRPPDLLRNPGLPRALAVLAERGLLFETWLFFDQIDALCRLADSCRQTIIVVDHLGGPLQAGQYAGPGGRAAWLAALGALASRANVRLKLSGLGMTALGADFRARDTPPTGADLARAWADRLLPAIGLLGAERCMFGSNFPVDKGQCSWRALWNGFKIATAHLAQPDREQLFSRTAIDTYRIGQDR